MLTGEPYAGDPHVRFGGRGGANQCAVSTPIIGVAGRNAYRTLGSGRQECLPYIGVAGRNAYRTLGEWQAGMPTVH